VSKYVVTGYVPGLDDDTSLEIEADSRDDAEESFRCQLLAQVSDDRAEDILNQVDEVSVFIDSVFGPYAAAKDNRDLGILLNRAERKAKAIVSFLEELMSVEPLEAVDLLTNSGEDTLDAFYGRSI